MNVIEEADVICIAASHVEIVVLLFRKIPDDRIEVDLELDEFDLTFA